MKYTRTTISIPRDVLALGQQRAAQFRLSLSEFIARLIEEEARAQRTTLTLVAEAPPVYAPHSATVAELERKAKAAARARKQQRKRRSAA